MVLAIPYGHEVCGEGGVPARYWHSALSSVLPYRTPPGRHAAPAGPSHPATRTGPWPLAQPAAATRHPTCPPTAGAHSTADLRCRRPRPRLGDPATLSGRTALRPHHRGDPRPTVRTLSCVAARALGTVIHTYSFGVGLDCLGARSTRQSVSWVGRKTSGARSIGHGGTRPASLRYCRTASSGSASAVGCPSWTVSSCWPAPWTASSPSTASTGPVPHTAHTVTHVTTCPTRRR